MLPMKFLITAFAISAYAMLTGCVSTSSDEDITITGDVLNKLQDVQQSHRATEIRMIEERTDKPIKDLITTDLQFDIGCRDRDIPIETCDYSNSLEVMFEHFVCQAHGKGFAGRPSSLAFAHTGSEARCDYTVNVERDDGFMTTIEENGVIFEYTVVDDDGLALYYGWKFTYDAKGRRRSVSETPSD